MKQKARERREKLRLILPYKRAFLAAWLRNGLMSKRALFLPEKPHIKSCMYRICHVLGIKIVQDLRAGFDLAIRWQDTTFGREIPQLVELHRTRPVINLRCRDISKRKIEEVHLSVFGYGALINPEVFTGPCVRKSNQNALHDGKIVTCPLSQAEPECVYQHVINNQLPDGTFEDIRVPVMRDSLPLCYLKARPSSGRFLSRYQGASLSRCNDVLSRKEQDLILRFACELGLDCGELDVLRDRDSGRIYVVDANNTPYGPPYKLDRPSFKRALSILAEAFKDAFLN